VVSAVVSAYFLEVHVPLGCVGARVAYYLVLL